MNVLAKAAMVLTIVYYGFSLSYIWLGQMFGLHNLLWEEFEIPQQVGSPPVWQMIVGIVITIATISCLVVAFRSLWRILDGGAKQDFRKLAKLLKHLSFGLFGFWLGYNIYVFGIPLMLIMGLEAKQGAQITFDPLNIEVIFLIISISIYAVSQTLQRAWEAEEENQQFL